MKSVNLDDVNALVQRFTQDNRVESNLQSQTYIENNVNKMMEE